jgi:hypothetical protein
MERGYQGHESWRSYYEVYVRGTERSASRQPFLFSVSMRDHFWQMSFQRSTVRSPAIVCRKITPARLARVKLVCGAFGQQRHAAAVGLS